MRSDRRVSCGFARALVCVVLAMLVFVLTVDASAQPNFRIDLEPQTARIGERVRVFLRCAGSTVSASKVQSVTFVDVNEDWEIVADWARDWRTEEDGRPGPWHATVKPFATGVLPLPPIQISYHTEEGGIRQARLTSVTLTVESVLAETDPLELTELRPPAPVPVDYGWVAWAIGGAVVGALIALLVWLLWRRRTRVVPVEPPLPPGLWALRELERRSRMPICQTGPARPIFSMVSEVVREYLHLRYGVPALDMTTRECLAALETAGVDERMLDWIRRFLDECDLVKFSRYESPRERWATIWNDAKLIVQRTTPPTELQDGEAPAREVVA